MATREPFNLVGFLFGAFFQAVEDARVQLVERGWFGHEARIQHQWHQLGYSRDEMPSRFIGPEHFVWAPGSPEHAKYSSLGDRPDALGGSDLQRQSFEEAWAPRAPGDAQLSREPDGHDIDR